MTRRERLIRVLIHFHHRHPEARRKARKQQQKIISELRAKIAERDQYNS